MPPQATLDLYAATQRRSLAAMLGGYERLLATTPERSRPVIAGAFGKSPEVCKQILEAV